MDINGRLINKQPDYGWIINGEVIILHGNDLQAAKVIHISIGPYGKVAGEYNENPMLNSMAYDVGYPYGTIRDYDTSGIVIKKNSSL